FVFYTLNAHTEQLDLHSFPTRRSSDLKSQVKEIVAFAKKFGISVYPTVVNMPGHMETALSTHPEFQLRDKYGKRSPSRLDVTNRSEEHTSELQSRSDLVCRLLLEKKNS